MELEDSSRQVNSILKRNLTRMENSIKERESNNEINLGRNENHDIYHNNDNLEFENNFNLNENDNIMNDDGMRNMYQEAGLQSGNKNLIDEKMSILSNNINFNNFENNDQDFLKVDLNSLKNFEKNFEVNKNIKDGDDQTRAETKSNFKFDEIENKVDEIHQHLDNLENFRVSYDNIISKLFGQNYEGITEHKEIMNDEVNELLGVINGEIQNEEIEKNISELNNLYNQNLSIEEQRRTESRNSKSSNKIFNSNLNSKSKFSDKISGEKNYMEEEMMPEYGENMGMDVIFENMDDFTNTSVLHSYNVWNQINKEDNFDMRSFSENQNKFGDYLNQNLKNDKMKFNQFVGDFPNQNPAFMFYNILEEQAKGNIRISQKDQMNFGDMYLERY